MENINIGIDLGTTNSGIGEYLNGKAVVLKNPIGFHETLPSVVSYKKERILVGDKAKEQLLTNAENVFSSFKRNIGTSEKYHNSNQNTDVTPVELSSLVLKELLNFSIDKKINSAVITIPASFSTVQSTATKEAGYKAGLEEVLLLQEPIAACLTYANENNLNIEESKKWLVYDFGGGTFDAALVDINERELKIIDHNGNNFLGGIDIDLKILEDIIIPKLENNSKLNGIWDKLKLKSDLVYQKFSQYLLYITEELKKELSLKEEAWLEINFSELDIYVEFKVLRNEFEMIIKPIYDETFHLINELMAENRLSFSDIERIILVGGTTYIPYIREKLAADSSVIIDTSIDPTTTVVLGATYYAGTRLSKIDAKDNKEIITESSVKVNLSYQNTSKDDEELISIQSSDIIDGTYRIYRVDGGFDTGKKQYSVSANEFVPLMEGQVNTFVFQLYDSNGELVYKKDDISINHGVYSVDGQPVPHDICIELDSEDDTYLELVFKKNAILPLKKTIYKTFSKSIAKGSDESIVFNIVEGKVGTMPGANLNIGYIELKGEDLDDDIIRGTDVELSFSISESRDLAIEIYLPSSEQEIKKTFSPNFQNEISIEKNISEINKGLQILEEQIKEKESSEDYIALSQLTKLKDELTSLKASFMLFQEGVLVNNKPQLNEKKRTLLIEVDKLIMLGGLESEIDAYMWSKNSLLLKIDQFSPAIKKEFNDIVKDEKQFLQSGDKYLIRRKVKVLEKIQSTLFFESPDSYYLIFMSLKSEDPSKFKNYSKVESLFKQGDIAFDNNELAKLKSICHLISSFYIDEKKKQSFSGTGLK